MEKVDRANVRIEVDFFHMLMMAEPFERFGDFAEKAGHIHLSGRSPDDSRRFFMPEDEPICYSAISNLKKFGYEGTVSVEVPLEYLTKEAAAASLQMMRKSLQEVEAMGADNQKQG